MQQYFIALLCIGVIGFPDVIHAKKIDEAVQTEEVTPEEIDSNKAHAAPTYESYLLDLLQKYEEVKKQRENEQKEVTSLKKYDELKTKDSEYDKKTKDLINEIKSIKEKKDANKLSHQELIKELEQEKNKENGLLRKKIDAQAQQSSAKEEFDNVIKKIMNTKNNTHIVEQETANKQESYVNSYGDQKKRDTRTTLKNSIETEQNSLTSNKNSFEQAQKHQTTLTSEQEALQERARQLKNRIGRNRGVICSNGKKIFDTASKYKRREVTQKHLQESVKNSTQAEFRNAKKTALKDQNVEVEIILRQAHDDTEITHMQNYGIWWGMGLGVFVALVTFYSDTIKNKLKGN